MNGPPVEFGCQVLDVPLQLVNGRSTLGLDHFACVVAVGSDPVLAFIPINNGVDHVVERGDQTSRGHVRVLCDVLVAILLGPGWRETLVRSE